MDSKRSAQVIAKHLLKLGYEPMDDKQLPVIIEGEERIDHEPQPRVAGFRRLNQRQENFYCLVLAGHTYAEAYKIAYNNDTISDSEAYHRGSALARHPQITKRLLSLRRKKEKEAISAAIDGDSWVLERLRHEAQNAKSPAARIKALELLGKRYNTFRERGDSGDGIEGLSLQELEQELRNELGAIATKPTNSET